MSKMKEELEKFNSESPVNKIPVKGPSVEPIIMSKSQIKRLREQRPTAMSLALEKALGEKK